MLVYRTKKQAYEFNGKKISSFACRQAILSKKRIIIVLYCTDKLSRIV